MSLKEIPLDGAALHITGELSAEASGQKAATKKAPESPAACGGEDARLRRAFDRCGDALYRFIALRVSGDRHTADDLLQQTCYEAARHRRIPGGEDAAQAWLFGIAKNLIRKHFRRLHREARLRIVDAAAWAHSPALQTGGNEPGEVDRTNVAPTLFSAMSALNETDQLILLGSYFEGRSHEELARAIGLSVRAIEGRLYRARQALRQAITLQRGNESL